MLRWFARLTRLSHEAHVDWPHIAFGESPHDAVVWVQGRAIIGNFARRYERRAEIYLFITTFVVSAAMFKFLLTLLTVKDTRVLQLQPLTWFTLLTALLYLFILVASSLFGALANESCETTIATLAHSRLAIRTKSVLSDEHLSATEEVLAIASDQLEILNRVSDARLFGLRADTSMAISLASAGFSAYVFIIFLLFRIGN